MAHEHGHGAGGGHDHGSGTKGRAFAIGVALNFGFVVCEIIYGVASHSVALLADAAHNLSDVFGLSLAWGALALSRRRPSRTHTYGLRRATILAALGNAVLLLLVTGGVVWEALVRLRHPTPVQGGIVLVVAAIGVVVNGGSALIFMRDRAHDANVRAAFFHLAGDAAVALGVVAAGGVIVRTGWYWLDPATSIVVSLVILFGTWGLLRDAVALSLDAVPANVDLDEVRAFLRGLPSVADVHDLHVWSMSTTEVAMTAHLVVQWTAEPPPFLSTLAAELHTRFDIDHVTVQFEPCVADAACGCEADGQPPRGSDGLANALRSRPSASSS
jgi:cobalt-zinc-cadmium efflux system protein